MNKHIIIIDDSSTVRTSVEFALKGEGYSVRQAENGSDALSKIEQVKNDGDEIALCISDINMPVMDGLEFITEFRKTDSYTPILILTTESEQNTIKKGKEAGASGWIIKPFQPDRLINVVKRFLK